MLSLNNVNILNRFSLGNNTPWYNYGSYLLNGVKPTFIHDYANNRYARYENVTNTITYSEDMNDASWTKTGCSITSSIGTNPNGISNACLITEDTSTGFHNLGKTVTGPANIGDPYTVSVYFKPNGRTQLRIQIPSAILAGTNYATFDTSTGAVITVGTINFTTFDIVTDNWWRCSISISASAAAGSGQLSILLLSGGSGSYTGDGTSGAYIWGVQGEYNGRPETYVGTTSASASAIYPLSQKSFPFTSTRTSNATMFDSNGNLIWAPANQFLYSADLSNASWTTSGSSTMTTGQTNFNGLSDAALYTEGSNTSLFRNTSSVTIQAGSYRHISLYMKRGNTDWCRMVASDSTAGTNSVQVWFNLSTGVVGSNSTTGTGLVHVTSSITSVGNGWYRCSLAFKIGTGTTSYMIISTASADGVTTRADIGSGAGIGSTILISYPQNEHYDSISPKEYKETRSLAYYGPRFDYDPVTGTKIGLLCEISITNELSRGSMRTGADMTVIGGSASDGSTYWGTWISARYTADGASSTHYMYATSAGVTPTDGQTRTASAVVKLISGQYVQLHASLSHSDTTMYANFDLINGTVTASGAGASYIFIRPLGNGIFHIGFTYTAIVGSTSGVASIVAALVTGSETRNPSTTSNMVFDIIHLQAYGSAGYTSIIPTYLAAATRAADTFNMGTGTWHNQLKGTFYSKCYFTNDTTSARYVFSISDTTSTNVFGIARSPAEQAQIRSTLSGATNNNPASGILPVFTAHKLAMQIESPTRNLVANGGSLNTASAAYPTTGMVRLDVGRNISGGYLNGWISEIRYYPDSSASTEQLQTLTT